MTSCTEGGGPDLCPDLEQSHGVLRDLLPRGRAWAAAQRPGTNMWGFWRAAAHLVEYANARICAATDEAFCSTLVETRAEWMAEYGLPDPCDPFPDLCAKVSAIGGTRCEYYAEVAARAGWALTCTDDEGACGAQPGCAQPGAMVPGGRPAGGVLRVTIDLADSPAYTGALYPPPQAGALKAGLPLGCPPDYSALLCLMDRMIHAHVEVIYSVSGTGTQLNACAGWGGAGFAPVLEPIGRFDPIYWTVDNPLTASASVITAGEDGLILTATLRTLSDLVGLKWQSQDKWSHRGAGYYTSPNLVGNILDFDFALSGLDPITDVDGLVLTATDDEDETYYIRLANYLTSGTGSAGHIHLDFTGAPVLAGFDITDFAQRKVVPWHRVMELSIGFAPPGYDKTSTAPLAAPIDVVFTLSNIRVTGSNTTMLRASPCAQPHALRMCDGYDDAYNLTPRRIVEGMQQLGYSGQYVIYVGASHLHALTYDAGAGSFVVDAAAPVSGPTRAWFGDLFARLAAAGFTCVISQSYEIFAAMCPEDWQQRDFAGTGARTGWTPPSTLVAPTCQPALDYLRDVALWFCGAARARGLEVIYQVGEPWWWDGSYTGGGPCIYDAATVALYESETGESVPTPYLTSKTDPVGEHGPYLDWCADKLGASTLWLRDQVKTAYPSARVAMLLFTPQVLDPASPITARLNLATGYWHYPAWDILQLEDYDWVMDGEWELHALTLTAGTATLGYPLAAIQYFAGFNLLAENAAEIWPRITQAIVGAFEWGIAEVCVWARPQVWRDGWLYPSALMAPALGLTTDPGPDPVEWVYPSDLAMVGSYVTDAEGLRRTRDIRLSFNPGGDTVGHTYTVEILTTDGLSVVRTFTLDAPAVVDGRVRVDYPVELNSLDFGFPPDFLAWRLKVDAIAESTGIAGDVPHDNGAFVARAVLFAGQSNALGHFTTLSGAVLGQSSAFALRAALAEKWGLSPMEVLPVEICWGSSAADKLADDDPVAGENYWYDVDAGTPGPRLTQALAILADMGIPAIVPAVAITDAQGENDAGAMNPASAPRTSSPARYKTAKLATYAALRAACGNPDLPIFIQTLGRGWWGDPPDPPEAGGQYYKAIRDVQVEIAGEQAATHIGSWVPGCETISGYVPETGNPGWVHYTAAAYHMAAAELVEAIATPLDRIADRPAWTLLDVPVGVPAAIGLGDAQVHFDLPPGAQLRVVNHHVSSAGVTLSDTVLTAGAGGVDWLFTAAAQTDAYGAAGGWVHIEFWQVLEDGGAVIKGPAGSLVFEVSALAGWPVAPVLGTTAWAVTGDWTIAQQVETEAGTTYRARWVNVETNATLKSEDITAAGPLTSALLTGPEQVDAYGAHARYVTVEVCRLYDGLEGPKATITGYDLYTPLLLDAAVAALWSDVGRAQAIAAGAETTHAALFPRTGEAKVVVGPDGGPLAVAANAVAYDWSTGARRDLSEGQAVKLLYPTAAPTDPFTLTVSAQQYGLSFWGPGRYELSGAHTAIVTGEGPLKRTTYTFTPAAGSLTLTPVGEVTLVGLEVGLPSSYKEATTAAVTRTTDVRAWSGAAAALLSGGGVTIAYRGHISSIIATQVFMATNISPLFYSQTGAPSRVTWFPPGGAQMAFIASYLPGEVGACLAWGNTGAAWSVNGATPGTNTTAATASISSMWFGSTSGMQAGCVHRISEVVIWPVKGSSAAIQAQAHVYGEDT